MSAVERGLARFLDAPGVTGVALVDGVTGLTYAVAGDETGDPAEHCETTALIGESLARAGALGEVESIIVTSARRHYVTLLVQRQGDPLLLTATLDRAHTNIALAMRDLSGRATEVLA
jgi:hypothetical protein